MNITINTKNLKFDNFKNLQLPFIRSADIANVFNDSKSYHFGSYHNIEDYINSEILYAPQYSIFGTDSLGGLAYFGKTEDMQKIKIQSEHYLQHSRDPLVYFLWELPQYSLLLLYENYQAQILNPYPQGKNVLFLEFGAWTGDTTLPDIVNREMDSIQWQVGEDNFNKNNVLHKNLLLELKNTLVSIHPDFDNDI